MVNSPPPRDAVLARLIASYPVFRDCQPLAIGVHKLIMAAHANIDKGALRQAMQHHTASTRYLKAVAAGGSRFGLDGAPAGEITAEQRKQAEQDLRDRFRKQADRRREQIKAQEHQARLSQLVDKFKPR